MIDASRGFMKDGNKNRLRAQDIHKIVDTFNRQIEIPGYSRMVPLSEISDPKNDYNLNLPRYIDSTEPEDLQDIEGHLRGGIPDRDIDALANYWKVFSSLRPLLFESAGRPGYNRLKLSVSDLKAAILGHPEFIAFRDSITALFLKWRKTSTPRLKNISIGDKPKALIETLSEDLLESFRKAPLLDAYDVYQHLMDYWTETVQDDAYMVVGGGWREAAKPRLIVEEKEKKTKEKADFTVGKQKFKADLIPGPLLIAKYFSKEQAAIESLEAEAATIQQQLEEMAEEHGGEEGLLLGAKNEKDKLTKSSVMERLKEIKGDDEFADEQKVLKEYLALLEKESEANDRLKKSRRELESKIATKYGMLTEDDIKTLVVDDKWLATLAAAVQSELDRVSQTLTGRIRQLAERYATPLPEIITEVETLAARVDEHLKKMGAIWK